MAVVNRMELGRELVRTLHQVGRQIETVERDAKKKGVSQYSLQDTNGNYMLSPLLTAKAQLLHALTLINAKDPDGKK
jgi:hypothetical protein